MAISSSGGVVSSGTTSNYSNGDSITDFTVYGIVKLHSATATSGLITSSGVEYAGQAGIGVVSGRSMDETVESGGVLHAENYGLASGTTIRNGGTVLVDNGGLGSDITVSSGGVVSAFTAYNTGGKLSSTTVLIGGAELIGNGGSGLNDIVASGASGFVYRGGTEVISSGSGSGMTASGGQIIVSSGGIAYNQTAASAGYINIAGGSGINTVVLSNAHMDVAKGAGYGLALGTVLSGGTEYLYRYGSSVSGVILANGHEYVGQSGGDPSRGVSISDTVSSGGQLLVENAGTATSASIDDGGLLKVDNGGQAIETRVRSGGVLSHSDNGGQSLSTYVESGGLNIVNNGGQSTSTHLATGGTETLSNGGKSFSTHVESGASEIISNGGYGYNDSAVQGGSILVSNGGAAFASSGTATNITALSGGKVQVVSSGIISGTTISSGASFYNGISGRQQSDVFGIDVGTVVESGGSALWYNRAESISAQIYRGASIDIGYGQDGNLTSTNMTVFSAATIHSGAKARFEKATVASDVRLEGGNMLLADSGARGYNTIVSNGGVETLANNTFESGAQISSGGTVVISNASSLINAALYDRGSINFTYLGGNVVSANVTSNGLLTAYSDNGKSTDLQLAGVYPDGENTFLLDGDTVTLVCFLAGTAIRTPSGETSVEALRIGDDVLTYDWRENRAVTQKIVWVGRQHSTIKPHLADDEAGYPVRICAGALADGVPARDLLVTPEHCLFFDGVFVPARMLVNGQSIRYDRKLTDYAVYHIETAQHSVLWADGALSESYLDTGNRRNFTQHGTVAALGRQPSSWEVDATAPLKVSRAVVEPIFRRIAERADIPETNKILVHEHKLRLLSETGQLIEATRSKGDRVMFYIPAHVRTVRLVSRASRPCDVLGPFVDDRRTLGVLIGAVTLFDGPSSQHLQTHLDVDHLTGWHDRENGPHRWTNGDAELPLESGRSRGERLLALQVLAAGPYEDITHTDDRPLRLQA